MNTRQTLKEYRQYEKEQLMANNDYEECYGLIIIKRTNDKGKPAVTIYKGRSLKPYSKYYFNNEESREDHINEIKEIYKNIEKEKKENRENAINSFEKDDILYSTWGYEQTNVDFYQIVDKTEKCVIIRQIACKRIEKEAGFMSEYLIPVKDQFIGEPMRKKVNYKDWINLTSYSGASKWDGKEILSTNYA